MFKPPSDDEVQREDEHPEGEARIFSPAYPRRTPAKRRAAAQSRDPFYADEHPEIPRVRRASLKQARAEILTVSEHDLEDNDVLDPAPGEMEPQRQVATKYKRSKITPSTDLEVRTGKNSVQDETQQRTKRGERAENYPFTGLETYHEDQLDTAKREQLTRNYKHRRPISAPSGPKQRPRSHLSRQISPRERKRRKGLLLVGLLVLLVLLLIPVATSIVRNITTNQQSSTVATVPMPRLQSVPSNPHELVIVPPDTDHPAPPVFATSAYVLDTDKETTLYAQNPYLHLPLLSTTKLMTASLAVESGKMDQAITVTPAMEQDIQQLSADSALFGVKQGETYTLRDLLYGLLYVSGNDAALVIADALAGNVANFVAEMNKKAQELGLHDTHFVNPHGLLDPGQYSCARDLAVLGQYSLSIPALQQISGGKSYQIAAGGNHDARILINENQFLWWYPGVTGGKTGYDGVSDFVQVMQVTRHNRHMIGVVMHTNNWWTDMRDLMDYGANDYTWNSPRNTENAGQPIPYDNLWNYFVKDTQDVNVPTVDNGLYYIYTGYSVSGSILSYFKQHGGLKTFGFPLKMPMPVSATSLNQQFQHRSISCDLSTKQCSAV